MNISISNNAEELGKEAAKLIAVRINDTISKKGSARIVIATGSSQFEMFQSLLKEKIDWRKVEVFHLDEYIGLPVTHIASFRKYLYERFINFVPVKQFHAVNSDGDLDSAIRQLTHEIRKEPVDIGLIGIGVNGHIAFNDPPADFETREAYIVVKLDDQCKMQQVNEGWFPSIEAVPEKAISMSVWQIMQCRTIISVIPHAVKADAVYKTFTSRLTNLVPATMLKEHNDLHFFLDRNSASRIVSFKK